MRRLLVAGLAGWVLLAMAAGHEVRCLEYERSVTAAGQFVDGCKS